VVFEYLATIDKPNLRTALNLLGLCGTFNPERLVAKFNPFRLKSGFVPFLGVAWAVRTVISVIEPTTFFGQVLHLKRYFLGNRESGTFNQQGGTGFHQVPKLLA
jgi:hypothetical protein